jgi:hypothetical protein
MLRGLRWLLVLVVGGGVAYYLARILRGEPAPVFSGTATPRPSVAPTPAWVDADGGTAPSTHPVKAKLKSGIYHLPGMLNYDRTVPDRWYRDAAAAEADGLRVAKR